MTPSRVTRGVLEVSYEVHDFERPAGKSTQVSQGFELVSSGPEEYRFAVSFLEIRVQTLDFAM